MTDDLKSRLRSVGGVRHDGATRWFINPDGPEAADYIEKLELVEKAYQQNQQTWSRNIARIEKLEAALQRANANVEEYERKFYLGADRIEKLESALIDILKVPRSEASWGIALVIARKALEGKNETIG